MNNDKKKILILGHGELGMAVVKRLSESQPIRDSYDLSLLTREAVADQKAELLDGMDIERVLGDVQKDSVDELAALFSDFEMIICCLGFAAGQGSQIKITKAVQQSEAKLYIPWQFGVDYDQIGRGSAQPVWDEQLDVRDMLRASNDVDWIIISTGMFTSFLFVPEFGIVDLQSKIVHALGSWDTSVTVTAPDDIGRLMAAILSHTPAIRNEIVYIAGDSLTYREIANCVERVTGQEFERVEWTIPTLKEQLAADSDNTFKKYRVVFAEESGVSWPMEHTFNHQHGIETQDVEAFLRSNYSTLI